jgi:ligand-binding SRPBCC domain-containing protein
MTTLTNDIHIRAPRQQVWDTLTQLDLLSAYDPGTKASVLTGEQADGVGAERRCDVRPGGWFIERVAAWEPVHTLAFELVTCSFPVNSLRHDYTLSESDGLTHVIQVMTYELKYKAVGRALDAVMLRRKWDAGIKAFLGGLKVHVETVQPRTPKA